MKKTTLATLYDQQTLLQLIRDHFNQAQLALEPINQRAQDLLAYVNHLHQRTII